MHITVNRQEFASMFRWAYGGLPKYAAVPVLSGMWLKVEDGTLTLSVFDYGQSRQGRLDGYSTGTGQILVSGPGLKTIISSLPTGNRVTVGISADGPELTLASQGITWTLPALPDEDYPELPGLPPLTGVADGAEFARAVGRVAPAVSRDDTLPVLTCICFETRSAALTLTATDRYRLALDRISWTPADPEARGIKVNVPALAAEAFAARAAKSGKVAVHLAGDLAAFSDDARQLIIRATPGDFPRMRKFLRATSPVTLTADAAALAAVVERMGKVSEKIPGTGDTTVALAYAPSTVTVRALALDETVRASEALPAKARGAGEFEVRFNAPHLASVLRGVDGQAVIGLAGDDLLYRPKQATINPACTSTFKAVLMPVRKQG